MKKKSGEDGVSALRSTSSSIGQLYPVLLDSHGQIIDGKHRNDANGKWRRIRIASITTKKDRIIARLVANVCRRKISSREKNHLLRDLAEEYLKEGVEPGRISHRIKEDTGMSYTWVMKYLPTEFKDPVQRERRLDTHHVTGDSNQKDPGRFKEEILSRIHSVQNRAVKIKEYKNTGFVAILLERFFYDRWKRICANLDTDPSLLIYDILESRLRELESELRCFQEATLVPSKTKDSLMTHTPL